MADPLATSSATAPPPELISTTTILSLALTVAILFAAYTASTFLLPAKTTTKTRVIYIWHLFDALTHFLLEGSFLYYSFFASSAVSTSQNPCLLGDCGVSYGAKFSTAPLAKLWQEYARADRRWEEADVCVVTLEILTVFGGGPLALWIAGMVRRSEERRWFWICVLAVGELYGGWMTFAPEWISGSKALAIDNWMYLWLYLFFFNALWVWIPLWLLWEAYYQFLPALELATMVGRVSATAETLGQFEESSEDDDEDDGVEDDEVEKER